MKQSFDKIFTPITNFFKRVTKIEIKPIEPSSALAEQAALDKKLVLSLAKQRFPTWQQLQYLPQYLSKKEKIIIRVLIALILASLAFLVVRFYLRHVEYLPKPGGSYSEALVGQPVYVNPVLAQSDVDRDLAKLVYSGLFKYNQGMKLVPDLAQSYTLSDDKKTYTIHLRPDIKWQNGNSLVADDIVFTFETIKDADYNSPYYSSFKGVNTERLDDQTVTFTLPEPFAPFLSNLTVGIIPAHLWNDISAGNFRLAEFNTKPIGSGPYQFAELTKDRSGSIKSYVLTRNDNYYGSKPNIDKITFKLYGDFESAVSDVKSHNVDGISYVPKDLKSTLTKDKEITIDALQLPQYTAVFFNLKNSILKNKDIRQALSYAVDKNTILVSALDNQGKIVDAPILEGFLGYNPDVKKYEFSANKAGELLDKAGWKIPEAGGLRQKDGTELKISLTTVDQPEYLKTAEILKQNWEALHIGIELKIMNSSRVDKEVIKPRNYDAFIYGEIFSSDPDPYPFWHSSQSLGNGLNLSNYYNKDADKLLEQARGLDNLDERAKKYIEFQNILVDDAPAVFLYSPAYDYGLSAAIKGYNIKNINIPSDRLSGIEDWYIKTKLGWQ